uniref:HMG box domain-containing protein n=1 Tax=viral metagenome TaxID=1070528 RepID=A0A6C0H1Z8_9ZZZZ
MNYANRNRTRIRTDNPGSTYSELGRILSDNWKRFSDEEKASYSDEAIELRQIKEAKDAQKRVLDEYKEFVEVSKADPTPSRISFVGEDYRESEKRWPGIGGKTRKIRKCHSKERRKR